MFLETVFVIGGAVGAGVHCTLFLGEIPSKIDKILFSSESITGGLCSMSN